MTDQTDPRANDITVFPQSTHPDGPYGGMMLRDQFALAALPAIITATSNGQHHPGTNLEGATIIEAIAHDAYELADAMLRERGK